MLTLLIPDCLTASITVAKAPKGTSSSARHKDRLMLRVPYLLPQLGANLINIDGIIAQKDALSACQC